MGHAIGSVLGFIALAGAFTLGVLALNQFQEDMADEFGRAGFVIAAAIGGAAIAGIVVGT